MRRDEHRTANRTLRTTVRLPVRKPQAHPSGRVAGALMVEPPIIERQGQSFTVVQESLNGELHVIWTELSGHLHA